MRLKRKTKTGKMKHFSQHFNWAKQHLEKGKGCIVNDKPFTALEHFRYADIGFGLAQRAAAEAAKEYVLTDNVLKARELLREAKDYQLTVKSFLRLYD